MWLWLCLVVGCTATTDEKNTTIVTDDVASEADTPASETVCAPACDGKTCGDDGCGGSCGTCGAGHQCVSDQCVTVAVSCVPADTAICGFPVAGVNLADPLQATSAFSTFGQCASASDTFPGAEVVIMFVATADEVVTLGGFQGASLFILEDDGSGCNVDSTCIAHAETSGTFSAQKGKIYYFVFEENDPSGPFDLDVSCCIPTCDVGACGVGIGDGCGGSCGTCAGGQTCNDGLCVDVGMVAGATLNLPCDETLVGLSTTNPFWGEDGLDTYPGCSADTFASPEVVTSFDVYFDGTVTVSSDVETFVLAASGTEPYGTCLTPIHGVGSFEVKLGHSYLVSFEGPAAQGATFDVATTCCRRLCDGQSCDDGCGGSCNLCENGYCDQGKCVPFEPSCTPQRAVACGDEVLAEDTATHTASLAFATYSCPESAGVSYSNEAEMAYTFVSDVDQLVSIAPLVGSYGYSGDNSYNSYFNYTYPVTVLEDLGQGCADTPGACLTSTGQPAFEAKAGRTYYLVFENEYGYTPASAGLNFAVNCCVRTCVPGTCGVDDGCAGICDCGTATQKCSAAQLCEPLGKGESCADPFVLPNTLLPFTVEGDLSSSGNQFSSRAHACEPGWDEGAFGRDHVYAFAAAADGVYTFTVASVAEALVYVMTDCVGAANADAPCVRDVYPNSGYPFQSVLVPMTAGQTVFVVVDSYSLSDLGTYLLTVSAPCHPTCDGVHCGASLDGCGGVCGCEGGQVCNMSGLCQPSGPGDSCATALPLDSQVLPIVAVGDTSTSVVDLYTRDCSAPHGDGIADVVYTFTPSATAIYAISVSAPGTGSEPYTAVVTGCGTTSDACLAHSSVFASTGPMTPTLEAGEPVYIIVAGVEGLAGPFTLTISLAP